MLSEKRKKTTLLGGSLQNGEKGGFRLFTKDRKGEGGGDFISNQRTDNRHPRFPSRKKREKKKESRLIPSQKPGFSYDSTKKRGAPPRVKNDKRAIVCAGKSSLKKKGTRHEMAGGYISFSGGKGGIGESQGVSKKERGGRKRASRRARGGKEELLLRKNSYTRGVRGR